MPAEIVTGHFCADWFSLFKVESSKRGKFYDVYFQLGIGAHCTCKAYEFSGEKRECKHIKFVMAHACLWNEQWYSGGDVTLQPVPDSCHYVKFSYPDQYCPNCGGPVCPVKIAV